MGDGSAQSHDKSHPDRHRDLELARAVVDGSCEAWHRLVNQYSGLVLSVIAKYVRDADEKRNVYVVVFEQLYKGRLAQYGVRAALSTWLVLVSRNIVIDHVRKCYGRRELPQAVLEMSKLHQLTFKQYFLSGWTPEAIRLLLEERGESHSSGEILAIISELDRELSRIKRRRLEYDLHARSIGAESGRLLEYLDYCQDELEVRRREMSPDARLLADETRQTLGRLMKLFESLPEDERRAYSLINRALRRMRSKLSGDAEDR